jgi:hypothetical protein
LSGSSSSGRGADDNKEEKILDMDQRQKRASISEEEEEEGGNPLPGTPQQPEQALDQDNEAFQQLEQQQHDEELQDEEPADQQQENEEARVEDAAIMSKEPDMTSRLQFWYGNSKDRTSIKWWCDAFNRIWDQKGWNNEARKKSTASVAVDSLREEGELLLSIIAKGHQAAAVKDWSLMKPILIKGITPLRPAHNRQSSL